MNGKAIFDKIIAENFPKPKKDIRPQKEPREGDFKIPRKKKTSARHIITKLLKLQRGRITINLRK